ncbi:hypothetical protein BCR32DRAFT_266755 [Anaeromyces robustus]|uniref:Thioredoxin domain-containing protein n=1 Tax=Anaeromyces robustus TaxID=1754192 RepID=A0A1Y1XDD6_9FUNG|nr:hypothetical protein BCR32DRAFT_266755 [Anaeromyces robustus]|eukprot:ORX83801.1 hypothetical protein BCR32DRAFT_266755 [Anaeromyces robustus]
MKIINSLKYIIPFLLIFVLNAFALSNEEKSKKLDELLAKSRDNFINLNEKYFDLLLTTPRDYHTIVLATATSPQIKCEPCRELLPEFLAVANSWNQKDKRVYFAIIDYQNGRNIFKKLKIQNVPNVLYFKPDQGTVNPEFYDLPRHGLGAEELIKFVIKKTGFEFELQRPTDYTQYIYNGMIIITVIVCILYALKYFKEIVVNKRNWMILTVSVIFLMISGFMWVHIRHPPNNGVSKSKVEFFVSGFQQQYGVESQIILVIYVLIAFSILYLSEKVKDVKNEHIRRISIYIALSVFFICFSLILRIFFIKSQAYPFKLLF